MSGSWPKMDHTHRNRNLLGRQFQINDKQTRSLVHYRKKKRNKTGKIRDLNLDSMRCARNFISIQKVRPGLSQTESVSFLFSSLEDPITL